jgi:hypothetical protein
MTGASPTPGRPRRARATIDQPAAEAAPAAPAAATATESPDALQQKIAALFA